MAPKLFIIGTGFIGGTFLNRFLTKRNGDYKLYALVRKDEQAEKLKSMGVHPVKGSLDSHDIIKQQTIQSDVVIHAATSDDIPSVKAILDGIESRLDKSKKIIYIHTSGTGVLCEDDKGEPRDYVHDDTDPKQIDQKIPDNADHREVDLTIKKFIESGRGGEGARIQIIVPPLIYGVGDGPFNKTSVQIPFMVQMTAASNWEYVGYSGAGKNIWGNVHIQNLMDGYEILLKHLEERNPDPSEGLYWFCEQGEHDFQNLAASIAQALYSMGKLKSPKSQTWKGTEWDNVKNPTCSFLQFGGNSRGRANRLRALGWEPKEKKTVFDSVPEEMEETLKRFGF